MNKYIYICICGVRLLVGVSPRESAKFRLNPSNMCSDIPSESSKSVCSCFISVHVKAPDCLKTLVWSYTYLILFVSKSEGSRNSMVRSKQVVLASCSGSPVNMSLKASLTAYLRWTHGTSSDSRTSEPSVRFGGFFSGVFGTNAARLRATGSVRLANLYSFTVVCDLNAQTMTQNKAERMRCFEEIWDKLRAKRWGCYSLPKPVKRYETHCTHSTTVLSTAWRSNSSPATYVQL